MMVPPGLSSPARSASSIIFTAMRSLIELPGLNVSTLTSTSALITPWVMRLILTIGVLPMASRIVLLMGFTQRLPARSRARGDYIGRYRYWCAEPRRTRARGVHRRLLRAPTRWLRRPAAGTFEALAALRAPTPGPSPQAARRAPPASPPANPAGSFADGWANGGIRHVMATARSAGRNALQSVRKTRCRLFRIGGGAASPLPRGIPVRPN